MCTAITYKTRDCYFGRNLDMECSFGEHVTVTPRNFRFRFRKMGEIDRHFAMIGMAHIAKGYPLYYDATNEKGLSMAGLNFPDNADYKPYRDGKDNVAPFELIPWVLGQCATVSDAETLLGRINLYHENFSEKLPLTPLHWLISDGERSLTLEAVKSGVKLYHNPVGVLTNNPPFEQQLFQLNNYMRLSARTPENIFCGDLDLKAYSRGMGGLGLPGDASSMSRFVRAVFVKKNSVSNDTESASVSQFFHILKSVEMQRGCVELGDGVYEFTRYSSCCNTDRGIYYYTTYENNGIHAVNLHRENLQGSELIAYPMQTVQAVKFQN
ncbi:MAG: choloylglycine hydrolase family protein [Ruminococcaceae bacterium]|nr:choloylglycine hydrolase family protein [Oscillospiraceae bacterium]